MALSGSIASSRGGVFCQPSPSHCVHTVPEMAWGGGHNVNRVKIGTKVSDIQG